MRNIIYWSLVVLGIPNRKDVCEATHKDCALLFKLKHKPGLIWDSIWKKSVQNQKSASTVILMACTSDTPALEARANGVRVNARHKLSPYASAGEGLQCCGKKADE